MTSQRAVPYCTVKGFRRALEALRRDPPPIVERNALVRKGLSPHAVYPVLGGLRYLGLVDPEGKVTADLDCFLDEADVDGRRRVVTRAYSEILPSLTLPVEDREDVDRLLVERHGCAPGVAAFCATFLLWLLAESGLPVARPDASRRGRPPAYLASLSTAARERMEADAAGSVELPEAFRPAETRPPAADAGAASSQG